MSLEVRRSESAGAGAQADRAFVRELGQRCVMSSVSSMRPGSEADAVEAFQRLCDIVEGQSHVTFVAHHNDGRVGFLLLLDELPDEVTLSPQAFVAYMAVEPGLARQGIGAALLAAAEDEARRCRLPYISLMVTEENEPARGLYERSGYHTERRLLCKRL
ncbi:MAG: GNAT family N-acetyltransferase [Candidatus Eremiobacteraeota bacterium]|nr:GNAT family N-acetyltransferase [Candidatus Eremiobacteraeota bacterium]